MTLIPAFLALMLPVAIAAQGPITITSAHMPVGGDTLRYTNVQVSSLGNYTATGANHTWNFNGVTKLNDGRRDFVNASQTPYFFFFLQPGEYGEKIADTLVAFPGLTLTNYFNFYRKQTSPVNAYVADGAGMSISGLPVPSYFTDRDELYMFPLSYPKYDSTSFRFSTPNTTIIPIRYSKAGYRVTKVDGWGTISTPFGQRQCLRLVTTQYSRDTIRSTLLPFPIGFQNNVRSYQWLTLTSRIPYFEVSGNLVGALFTPNTARFRSSEQPDTGFEELFNVATSFYPNPAHDFIHIVSDRKITVYITDIFGRIVLSSVENTVDVSHLAPGVYLITAVGYRGQRFIKE